MNCSRFHCPWIYHRTKVSEGYREVGVNKHIKPLLSFMWVRAPLPHTKQRDSQSHNILLLIRANTHNKFAWWTYLTEEYKLLKLRLFCLKEKSQLLTKELCWMTIIELKAKEWQVNIICHWYCNISLFLAVLDVFSKLDAKVLVNISEIMQLRTEINKKHLVLSLA